MRLRIRFAKLGRVRWTSHRDVARMWERALRRAGAPLAYTGGFSPRPQLSFGLALPTGCESVAEYVDVALVDSPDADASTQATPSVEELGSTLSALLPNGVDVLAGAFVDASGPSLQQAVTCCSWTVEVLGTTPDALSQATAGLLGAETVAVRRERKGREVADDLRPSVLSLSCPGAAARGARLLADLATRPRGVRPAELAAALGVEFGVARRTCQWIEDDGSRREPLEVGASTVAQYLERAS